jgi:hypothetical protein
VTISSGSTDLRRKASGCSRWARSITSLSETPVSIITAGRLFPSAKHAQGLDATHSRHFDVEKNDVNRRERFREPERLLAVSGDAGDLELRFGGKHHAERLRERRIIVADEDADPLLLNPLVGCHQGPTMTRGATLFYGRAQERGSPRVGFGCASSKTGGTMGAPY